MVDGLYKCDNEKSFDSQTWLMVCTWDQEFRFVEHGQLFLTAEPLDDARHLQIYN